ncbi:MAG: ParB N-terminal domain-containing protein [bacterium]|nr:ParB N-terminal domain-containing protein [bacterium]
MAQAVLLSIGSLRFSEKKRRGVSEKRVEELRRLVEAGRDLPPIRVHALGDGTYVVRDGRHRIKAHLAAGIDCIFSIVENVITITIEEILKLFRWCRSFVRMLLRK